MHACHDLGKLHFSSGHFSIPEADRVIMVATAAAIKHHRLIVAAVAVAVAAIKLS